MLSLHRLGVLYRECVLEGMLRLGLFLSFEESGWDFHVYTYQVIFNRILYDLFLKIVSHIMSLSPLKQLYYYLQSSSSC